MVMKVVEMGEDGSKRACAGSSSLFDDNCRSFRPLALEVRLHLARVSSMNEVLLNVEVMHMNLDLSVSGTPTVQHTVELPAKCEPDGVGGKWSKKNKTLTVMLPLLAQQTREACERLHALLIPTQQPAANEAPPELAEHSANKQDQLQQHQGAGTVQQNVRGESRQTCGPRSLWRTRGAKLLKQQRRLLGSLPPSFRPQPPPRQQSGFRRSSWKQKRQQGV